MSELPMVRLVLHEEPLSLKLLRQALCNYRLLCHSLSVDCETRARLNVKSSPVNATLALERRSAVYEKRAVALGRLIDQLPAGDELDPPAPGGHVMGEE